MVGYSVGVSYEIEWYGSPDHRSYRVSFKKFKEMLGYEVKYTPDQAAREIYNALRSGTLIDSPKTHTVNWYKHLLASYELMKEVVVKDTVL